jgi:hypothetical protein
VRGVVRLAYVQFEAKGGVHSEGRRPRCKPRLDRCRESR